MPITRDNIREAAKNDHTDAKIDAALAKVDQAAARAAERARWTSEVWDRTSPINGVPAAHFLNREDVSDAPIYLLLCDGEVVYFQPHQADAAGLAWLTVSDIEKAASAHADKVAESRAGVAIIGQVLAVIEGSEVAPL